MPAAITVLAAGCAVHEPGFDEPIPMPAAFAGGEIADAGGAATPPKWWQTFKDDVLSELQERALAGNFDVAVFRDRLRAARAVVDRERSLLFPAFDYFLFADQAWLGQQNGSDSESSFGASLIGAYEVDLWRRNASTVEEAALQHTVAREQLVAAAISLSADVALTWYALVEQRGQASVLEAQIQTNEKVLQVLRARFGGGVVRASDVLRQERLLESTREQRAVVRSRIEVLEHALLVLIGRSPTETLGPSEHVLPALPPRPAVGLPADLVQRRPDVRSAFYAIQAADASVAAAVADQYPSVTIRLDATTVEDQIAEFFDSWFAVIGVDVVGPLFDAGSRKAEVRRTEAVKAERVNVYAQTILVAFRQVVDALSREQWREQQIQLLELQLELAQRTSERLNREYLNGDISYIDVLDALTTEQQLQRDLLFVRFQRIGDRIDLHRALAGGWEGIVPQDAEHTPGEGA